MSRRRASGARQEGGVFLLDLLSNALVAVMALMLIALSKMGPGGAEPPKEAGRERLAPAESFVPAPAPGILRGQDFGVVVQVALQGLRSEAPSELKVLVDGVPGAPEAVRILRGLGSPGDLEAERHHAALLLTPRGTRRNFGIGFSGAAAAANLVWRVTAGREVILTGAVHITDAARGDLLKVCVDSAGRVSAGLAGRYMAGC